jgi:CCR4-NOT transcription complex subunit 1
VTECPEIAILGAAFSMAHDQSGVSSNGVLADFITQIGLPPFLSSQGQAQTNAAAVLHRMWASGNAGQTCVARAMAVTHEREGGASVPRMLDVCQDLKALSPALARAPHALAVELAALAARREYLNLEMWLQERAAASGAPFAAACLRFLRARATGDEAGVTPGAPKLAVETMAIFFKVLHAGAGGLPPDLRQELQGVAAAAARVAQTPPVLAVTSPLMWKPKPTATSSVCTLAKEPWSGRWRCSARSGRRKARANGTSSRAWCTTCSTSTGSSPSTLKRS